MTTLKNTYRPATQIASFKPAWTGAARGIDILGVNLPIESEARFVARAVAKILGVQR
jgi:hypothetical protein